MSANAHPDVKVPPSRIWNVCMLAHVDHGKSALTDSLIASNGIISTRSAGKARYMDSREDEQRRGITMKSSSIALGHRVSDGAPLNIINLIDSPGHVDFSGEVEAALRICDGTFIVVDVVEGVCVQTVTVLRAALKHELRPVLVLNKIDRLFVELELDPQEAYEHILGTLAEVNVIMGVRQVEKMMAAASELDTEAENESEWSLQEDPADEHDNTISGYFSPEVGNVVFASAVDGWAFRIIDFAKFFSERQGISRRVLNKTLWGEYYLQSKTKRIVKRKANDVRSKSKPMFVQCIMSNIHAVYDTILKTEHDHDLAVKKRKHFVSKLGINVNARDLNHRDASTALKAIMNSWLPASSCLLNTVIQKLPCVAEAQVKKNRLHALWGNPDDLYNVKFEDEEVRARVLESLERQQRSVSEASKAENDPFVAYVAKMIEKDAGPGAGQINIRTPKTLEERQKAAEQPASEIAPSEVASAETMVAFARILSGTISVGDSVYVYSPKYKFLVDCKYDEEFVTEATVTDLYLLMGRGMDTIRSASAGCVVGIGGLEDCVLKTATLSSEPPGYCLPVGFNSFAAMSISREALVRVAVEPHLPSDAGKLQSGLRRLNQADPAVETFLSAKGEHIIAANGELHLERCLKDLRERFAKGVRIHVSKPIVPFRETVTGGISPNVALPVDSQQNSSNVQMTTDSEALASREVIRSVATINLSVQAKSSAGGSPWRVNIEKDSQPLNYLESGLANNGRFVCVSNESVSFRITAAPIPAPLATVLDRAGIVLRSQDLSEDDEAEAIRSTRQNLIEAVERFAKESKTRKTSQSSIVKFWLESVFPLVWSCGPRQFGSNILVGPYPYNGRTACTEAIFGKQEKTMSNSHSSLEIEKAIVNGFQLGTRAGPLCEEPMHGVAIFLDLLNVEQSRKTDDVKETPSSDGDIGDRDGEFSRPNTKSSIASGAVIGSVREAVRMALMHGNARLMEGVLHVDISVPGAVLGKTYTVLGQRRGRVLNEEMKEGINVFGIEAYMPVQDSFGFADVLRKQTSGFAVPQMIFSHWECIDLDPFWYPQTEEELEDLGVSDTTAENNNIARRLVNAIRRRKGLKVEEKIVGDAEKQRTLSRKK
ncbi:Elongation factor Tu GTP-binding domain containing protein [Gracilaria domingensis]|nr:Elongation factor Tu GTP-binding domain containing protein [Gracilaria domingensis]